MSDNSTGNTTAAAGSANLLNFQKMLERFYLNQCPPDPTDPKFSPPVNLQERRQN